jgi:hypothetical protein
MCVFMVAHYGHLKCLINQSNNMLLWIARINAAITLMGRESVCQSVNSELKLMPISQK